MPPDLTAAQRDSLLEAAKEIISTAVTAFDTFGNRTAIDNYSDESAAGAFIRALGRRYGPDGSWPSEFNDRIVRRVVVYLAGARDLLLSLQSLIESRPYALGVAPISRAASEASGRIVWLLDKDLWIDRDARKRVARLLLDEYEEATRRKTLMNQLQHQDRAAAGDAYRKALDSIHEVRSPYFYPSEVVRNDEKGFRTVCGETMPKTSAFVTLAADVLGSDSGDAAAVYGYLSSVVHPTVFGYVEGLALNDPVYLCKISNYTVLSLYNGWRCLAGWLQDNSEDSPELDTVYDNYKLVQDRIRAYQL